MWSDVVDFRDFYETQRGRVAQHLVGEAIRAHWPDLTGQRLLGFGYPTPYLRQFVGEAERVIAFMPASRGVIRWPPDGANRTSLVEETDLPLPDYSVDRVLLVHGLEYTHNLPAVMSEIWRVLTAEGKLICVAPNRLGLWARSDGTPLGWGHPYSGKQLSRMLRDHQFTPTRTSRALFVPPVKMKAILGSAMAWERVGARFFPRASGVVVLEASKQIYAVSQERKKKVVRRPVLVQIPKSASRTGLKAD